MTPNSPVRVSRMRGDEMVEDEREAGHLVLGPLCRCLWCPTSVGRVAKCFSPVVTTSLSSLRAMHWDTATTHLLGDALMPAAAFVFGIMRA